MTINYYLMRQQVSLMRAKAARSVEARLAHEGLARAYTLRLRELAFPKPAAVKT
jgi:hypothetical protein